MIIVSYLSFLMIVFPWFYVQLDDEDSIELPDIALEAESSDNDIPKIQTPKKRPTSTQVFK